MEVRSQFYIPASLPICAQCIRGSVGTGFHLDAVAKRWIL